MALRVSQACRAARRIVGLLVLLGALVAIANLAGDPVAWAHGDTFLVSTLLYLVAPISIARHLLLRHQIDQQTILGTNRDLTADWDAVRLHLPVLDFAQPGPFFGPHGEGTLPQDLFFSFATLTTTGYGDLVPAGNPGQGLAVLDMVTGQLFLVTAVAKVISAYRPARFPGPWAPRRRTRGQTVADGQRHALPRFASWHSGNGGANGSVSGPPATIRYARMRALTDVTSETLRQWRESQGWDVPRMARELRKAARGSGEDVAAHHGLVKMIPQWERGNRTPRERHRLLYLKIFQDAVEVTRRRDPVDLVLQAMEVRSRAARLPGPAQIKALEAAALAKPRQTMTSAQIRALAAEAIAHLHEVAGKLAELSALLGGDETGQAKP